MMIEEARRHLGADYELTRELGRGGMAVVYDAFHRSTGRRVALKVLPPHLAFANNARERFVREAQLSAVLDHPGIARVYTAGTTRDIAYFAMDLVDGESLAGRLDRQPPLEFAQIHAILADLADALGYAHAAKIVHRDIKPDNILIDSATGRPVLTDFGIARALDDESRMTVSGVAIGTPSYMSPEQAEGRRDIDARCDLYSLGVVGYQLLTGKVPFEASNTPALMAMHALATPTPVLELRPDAPPAIAAAVERALAKKPDDRWQSAAAFQGALGSAPAERVSPRRSEPSVALRNRATASDSRIAGVERRIRNFRRRGFVWLVATGVIFVVNMIVDREIFVFIPLAWLCALDLLIHAARLYADDISVREMFLDRIQATRPEDQFQILPSAGDRHNARYENAKQGAARDHTEVVRMLRSLSRSERALVQGIAETADALNARVGALADQLRQLDESTDPNAEQAGIILLQLDSTADALRDLRLRLQDLRDSDFERGLDEIREQLRVSGLLVQ